MLGKLYMPNSSSASTKIINSTKCTISDNDISVYNKSGRYNSSGIAVYGGQITKDYSKTVNLKAGNYSVKGININNNKIISTAKTSYGIILEYVNGSSITSNKMTSDVKTSGDGINLTTCKDNTFASNSITAYDYGVNCTEKSKDNKFKKNKIHKSNNYAITVSDNSTSTIYYGNSIKDNEKGKYEINDKAYPLYGKDIKLKVTKTKKANNLKWNKIKGASGYRIYRSTKKNGTYKLIKTVKDGKKTTYVNKKSKKNKNKKYYYKVAAYKSAHGSKIIGKQSNIA